MPVEDAVAQSLVVAALEAAPEPMTAEEVAARINLLSKTRLAPAEVRAVLRTGVGGVFEEPRRGRFQLASSFPLVYDQSNVRLYQGDAIAWLRAQAPASIHGVVTDPPYGVVEYTDKEVAKLRAGRGGVWRLPPAYDGHQRAPLPRFTTLTDKDLAAVGEFFREWAGALYEPLVPGAHLLVASNPLLSYLVAHVVAAAGFERRGEVVRLVQTMRGGDRPKNAHVQYASVTVMPRSQWEPWLLFRKPLEGTVKENLDRYGTGGLRRPSAERPFGDVIASAPTHKRERTIANHPSLKPQAFLRQVVRAILPLGTGVVLDSFAGSGSTLAAARHLGYTAVGTERDPEYCALAAASIDALSTFKVG